MSPASLPDEVRTHAASLVAEARTVRIDRDRLAAFAPPEAGHDTVVVAPPGASEADVAAAVLITSAVNFGSGWFPTLAKRRDASGRPISGARSVAAALTERFAAHGPWTNAELRAIRTEELAATLGQRADHELVALYVQALRELGRFLGERDALGLVRETGGSAAALAGTLAGGMTLWADRGFYKRAQLLPSELSRQGVAAFTDLDRLTIFADNLVPHVLRCAGVLVYDPLLAAHIDRGELLPFGPWEREIRASAVHACAALAPRLGLSEPELDHRLWWLGQSPEHKARPRHRCRTVYY